MDINQTTPIVQLHRRGLLSFAITNYSHVYCKCISINNEDRMQWFSTTDSPLAKVGAPSPTLPTSVATTTKIQYTKPPYQQPFSIRIQPQATSRRPILLQKVTYQTSIPSLIPTNRSSLPNGTSLQTHPPSCQGNQRQQTATPIISIIQRSSPS